MHRGYIKLHRKFTEWEWYKDKNTMLLFLHLLITANYKASRFMGNDIPVGSVVIGRKALAASVGLTERKIRTSLDKLKNTGEVTIKTTNKFSVLTIVNYSDYQDGDRIETSKKANNRPTTDQQPTTSKEGKKVSSKEINNNEFELFWSCYPKKKNKGTAEKAWNKIKHTNGTTALIMAGLDAAKVNPDWVKDNGQFIPYPATWLNAKGWEDEHETTGNARKYV